MIFLKIISHLPIFIDILAASCLAAGTDAQDMWLNTLVPNLSQDARTRALKSITATSNHNTDMSISITPQFIIISNGSSGMLS